MATLPRVPPRFVPTLTEVVREESVPAPEFPLESGAAADPGSRPAVAAISASPGVAAGSASAAAPVGPFKADFLPPGVTEIPSPPALPSGGRLSEDFEELLVHRVMQRVDVTLDLRLHQAIASVVLEQTRSILPRLREEVEAVVRDAVYEAVAEELAAKSNQ